MTRILTSLLLASLAAGCGGHDHDHDHPAPANTGAAATTGHAPHTERTRLGELALGSHAITVFQVAPITPGKEADFDLDFAAPKLPETVRGWIGPESGKGSLKVRFLPETEVRMHGHPEVPDPIPAGSAIWFEVETPAGPQRGSLALPH